MYVIIAMRKFWGYTVHTFFLEGSISSECVLSRIAALISIQGAERAALEPHGQLLVRNPQMV